MKLLHSYYIEGEPSLLEPFQREARVVQACDIRTSSRSSASTRQTGTHTL
jgi:hypothetical protein